ncbi:MAG: hypothetical protein K2F80_06800, partial [Muribaculaceae bacterium]|nr:hypothetical protein [Muribaculaceae bacterium]
SDLTCFQVESLLRLIDTPTKRCELLKSLYVVTANLEKFCVYNDSPLAGQTDNPMYKLLLTTNDIIGCILKSTDKVLPRSYNGGVVIDVIPTPNKVNYVTIK